MTWKTLRHPNVLPLLGVTMSEGPLRFVMVSEWMKNGNINQFLECVDADRLKLVCLFNCLASLSFLGIDGNAIIVA